MPLTVTCGPFQPTLEEAFLAHITNNPPGPGRAVAVVAPSQLMVNKLSRLSAAKGGGALLNIRFFTFTSLALEIVAESGLTDGFLLSDEFTHDKIIDFLLQDAGASLGASRMSKRLAGAVRATLKDLEEAGVEPAHYQEHLSELFSEKPSRDRLEALLRLQEKYRAHLQRCGVVSGAEVVRRATAALDENRSSALRPFAEVLYYGFYDLNGLQADFYQAVTRSARVHVFFPYCHDSPSGRFAKRFYETKLLAGGSPSEHPAFSSEKRALGKTIQCLFDPERREPLPAAERLRLVSVSGERDEAWRAAKEIRRAHERADNPMAFHEMGVVARTLDPYAAHIRDVFKEHAIPFYTPEGEPLFRYPAAKRTLNLLTLHRRNYPVADIKDVLTSPWFRKNKKETALWLSLLDNAGVSSGWAQWEGRLAAYLKENTSPAPAPGEGGRAGPVSDQEAARSLWAFFEYLRGQLSPAGPPQSWKTCCDRALSIVKELFHIPAEGPEAAVWECLCGAVGEMRVMDSVLPHVRWEEYVEALEEKLRCACLPLERDNRGVRVLNAMDARGESFRLLIVLGLKDGLFPRRVQEDPLLPDVLRQRLEQQGGYWLLPKNAGHDEEKLLFTLLMSSAAERVVCLVPRSDEEGKAVAPSSYVRELCRAAGLDYETAERERVSRRPLEKLAALSPEELTPGELSLLLVERGGSLAALGAEGESLAGLLAAVAALSAGKEPGAYDGIVPRADALLKPMFRRGLSPTAMDSFAACPFQFFAARVLDLGEPEEGPERGRLEARLKGKIYHRVLQLFYERLGENGRWPPPDGWESDLRRAFEEVFAANGWRPTGLYPLVWESAKTQMWAHLKPFAAWDMAELKETGFVPTHLERPMTAALGALKIHGRPDRVDVCGEKGLFRVIDYKTRWSRFRPKLEKAVLARASHQPFFYLEMARQLNAAGAAEGAHFYMLENDSGGPRQSFTAEAWRAHREELLQSTRGFTDMMARGLFFIAPQEGRGKVCEYCPFAFVCRKNHAPTRWRAQNSRERAAFDALHGGPADDGEEENA